MDSEMCLVRRHTEYWYMDLSVWSLPGCHGHSFWHCGFTLIKKYGQVRGYVDIPLKNEMIDVWPAVKKNKKKL